MAPLPRRSAEVKVDWLGGDWPWVFGTLSPVFFPPGWCLTDYAPFHTCVGLMLSKGRMPGYI